MATGLPNDIHESTQLSFVKADTKIQEAHMSAEQSKAAMMWTEKMHSDFKCESQNSLEQML